MRCEISRATIYYRRADDQAGYLQSNHNKMLKMRARLPFDFYLHQCATMGDRVWALAPGK